MTIHKWEDVRDGRQERLAAKASNDQTHPVRSGPLNGSSVTVDRPLALKIADKLLAEIQADGPDGFGEVTVEVERGEITFIRHDRRRKGAALFALAALTR